MSIRKTVAQTGITALHLQSEIQNAGGTDTELIQARFGKVPQEDHLHTYRQLRKELNFQPRNVKPAAAKND